MKVNGAIILCMKQYLLTLLLLFSFHVVWADNETKKELEENKESIDRAVVNQLSTTVLQQEIKQLKKENEYLKQLKQLKNENEDLKNQLNIQERKLDKTRSAFATAIKPFEKNEIIKSDKIINKEIRRMDPCYDENDPGATCYGPRGHGHAYFGTNNNIIKLLGQ